MQHWARNRRDRQKRLAGQARHAHKRDRHPKKSRSKENGLTNTERQSEANPGWTRWTADLRLCEEKTKRSSLFFFFAFFRAQMPSSKKAENRIEATYKIYFLLLLTNTCWVHHVALSKRCEKQLKKAKNREFWPIWKGRGTFFFAGNPSDFGRKPWKRPLTSMRKHVPTHNVHTTYLVLYLGKTGTYQLAFSLVFCNEDLFR